MFDAAHQRIAAFVKIEGPDSSLRLWTGSGDFTFKGETYVGTVQGVNPLMALGSIEDSGDMSNRGVGLTLSAVPESVFSYAMNTNVRGAPMFIWLAQISETYPLSVVGDPELIFRGTSDYATASADANDFSVGLQVEDALVTLLNPRILRYNRATQIKLFPDDRGMDFAAAMENLQLIWGTFRV